MESLIYLQGGGIGEGWRMYVCLLKALFSSNIPYISSIQNHTFLNEISMFYLFTVPA